MDWGNLAIITILGFVLGTVDAAFGMGYGTILTPVLILFGYKTLDIVPAVIISQLVADFLSVFFHHQFKNVNMSWKSKDFKVGSILAGFIVHKIPSKALKVVIGVLTLIMGTMLILKTARIF